MVLDYYKLREQPFGVTPDSRYLYASATHREALASLLYGIEQGRGFVALIAQPGMGKTTLLFHALELLRVKATTAFLFQTMSTPVDLMQALLADLGVRETGASLAELQGKLNSLLAEYSRSGKRLVVVLDEAQKLDEPVLELLRMLSNFETGQEKLVQIVLAGQPQLAEKLASPDLVQLRQRISIIARLNPFSAEETALYIGHRSQMAGLAPGTQLFDASALALIAQASQGIPRNINNLCFNALSLGYALKQKTIGAEIIREVLGDLDLQSFDHGAVVAEPQEKREEQKEGEDAYARALKSSAAGSRWSWAAALLRRPVPSVAIAALALAAGLGLSGRFLGHGQAPAETMARAESETLSAVPPEENVPVLQLSEDRTVIRQRAFSRETIRVKPGETLYAICAQSFGSCNDKLLQRIFDLNPQLGDMDHIEPGQTIRVRTAGKLRESAEGTAVQPVGAVTAKGETP
jgi:general secretion pathway protein A